MDILQNNINKVREAYSDTMDEYEEKYFQEYKKKEQKEKFLRRLKLTVNDMEAQIEMIDVEIEMIPNRETRSDFFNSARALELNLNDLHLLLKEIQYSPDFFDQNKLTDLVDRRKELGGISMFETGPNSERAIVDLDELNQNRILQRQKRGVIRVVDGINSDALVRLDNIILKIGSANNHLKELTQEISAQNIKLLEMDDLLRQTQSVLYQMGKLVSFFNKTFLKEKCMKLLIVLMVLLCVGCVALIFMNKAKSSRSETAATDAAVVTGETTAVRRLEDYIGPILFGKTGMICSSADSGDVQRDLT